MPVYEYLCQECNQRIEHWWPSVRAAEQAEGTPLPCPRCQSTATRRMVSRVTVLGSLGGLTPSEQQAQRAQEERLASITPREVIDRLQKPRQEGGA